MPGSRHPLHEHAAVSGAAEPNPTLRRLSTGGRIAMIVQSLISSCWAIPSTAAQRVEPSELRLLCLSSHVSEQGLCEGYVAASVDAAVAAGNCPAPPTDLDLAIGEVVSYLEDVAVMRGTTTPQVVVAALCDDAPHR